MTNDKTVTMSREQFQAINPVPYGVFWSELDSRYMTSMAHLNCLEYQGKWLGWQSAILAAPVVERQPVRVITDKPCPLWVPNARLDLHAVGDRCLKCEGTKFIVEYRDEPAPPELAELQATIARQKNLLSDQELNAAALCRELQSQAAEIERLKGGQGEAVASVELELVYNKMTEGLHIRRWENFGGLREGVHRLFASQPAPVSVVLPSPDDLRYLISRAAKHADLTNGANYYTAAELAAEALIDKVKELNQ